MRSVNGLHEIRVVLERLDQEGHSPVVGLEPALPAKAVEHLLRPEHQRPPFIVRQWGRTAIIELSKPGQQRRAEAAALTDDDPAEHPEKRWLQRLQRLLGIDKGVDVDAIHDTGISHGRTVLAYADEVHVALPLPLPLPFPLRPGSALPRDGSPRKPRPRPRGSAARAPGTPRPPARAACRAACARRAACPARPRGS